MSELNLTENHYEVSFCCSSQEAHVHATAYDLNEPATSAYTLMNGLSPTTDYSFADAGSPILLHPVRPDVLPGISDKSNQSSNNAEEKVVYSIVGAKRKSDTDAPPNPYVFAEETSPEPPTRRALKRTNVRLKSLSDEREPNNRGCLACSAIILAILCSIAASAVSIYCLLKVSEISTWSSSVKDTDSSTFSTSPPPVVSTSLTPSDECVSGHNACHTEGGICVSTAQGHGCFCKDGWFGDGRSCTERTYRTCEELRTVVGFNTGYYKIYPDPGNVEPLIVRCQMESDKGITELGHDSEQETLVDGCEDAGCYSRNVTYFASMEQIVAIIEASSNCSQFIKYECYHSAMNTYGVQYAWWVSRHGTNESRWGGAIKDHSCACSNNDNTTCPGCYCNINDSTEREDKGYITDKTLLPVIQLRFGDTGDTWERGHHTLGKLQCYG